MAVRNKLPRWADHAGVPFLASRADDVPMVFTANNYRPWFRSGPDDVPDLASYGDLGTGFLGAAFDRGNWGRKNFLVRPARGICFLHAASAVFNLRYDAESLRGWPLYTAYAGLGRELRALARGSGLQYAMGTAGLTVPRVAFGNPSFPDGWPYHDITSVSTIEAGDLAPGSLYLPSWLWALTQSWPGDPRKIAGGDLLVFLVAHEDNSLAYATGDPDDEKLLPYWGYHNGVAGMALNTVDGTGNVTIPDPSVTYADQPTKKFLAHEARFRSLVGKLDRFRCVVIRDRRFLLDQPLDQGNLYTSGHVDGNYDVRDPCETHVVEHFRNAVNGGGGYRGLRAEGVELLETDGPPASSSLWALAKAHFGIR